MNYIIVYNFEADYFQLKFSIKGTLACLYCIAGKHEGAKFDSFKLRSRQYLIRAENFRMVDIGINA